jgi:FMN phosphatase YigB (HAD superfamily)
LPFESYNFERKAVSKKPFEMALEKLRLEPNQTIMVEDLQENLKIPKDMGMVTVYITHGLKPESVPSHVDLCCDNAADLLAIVSKQKAVA